MTQKKTKPEELLEKSHIDWSSQKIAAFQEILLDWYAGNYKDLPWRHMAHNPYAIWVSEIMCQQTQTGTVIPYFEHWLTLFPTLEKLAAAPEEKVLKAWEGLGYYSRARNLQAGAQKILQKFGGKFPEELSEILSIKGIGPYTAAAIGSICFGLVEPAIDGNLFRVTSRLFEISADISEAKTRSIFSSVLRDVMSHERPGDFNQAMMDLGNQICKPKEPDCLQCPIRDFCGANRSGHQESFPVKSSKIKPKDVYYQAFVLEDKGAYYLVQRPTQGLLAAMWTFPMIETKNVHPKLPDEFSVDILKTEELGEITHVFSHLRWHVRVIRCQLAGNFQKRTPKNAGWYEPEDFTKLVFPRPQVKMLKLLNLKESKRK
ncbi:MAG: A/G-specific adenine glycosylase [Streptococcaceae bacterium]|jgi:A/G-specific adenine glycosylase|nr:A/G-specific adenine glycosylase [Streptococcaceae bacterium]